MGPDNLFLEKLKPKQISIDFEDLIDLLRTDTISIYEEDYIHDISSEKNNANKNIEK